MISYVCDLMKLNIYDHRCVLGSGVRGTLRVRNGKYFLLAKLSRTLSGVYKLNLRNSLEPFPLLARHHEKLAVKR